MKTTTQTIGLRGLEAVRVKIDIETCEAGFEIVGLSEAAARETRVRVRSTLGREECHKRGPNGYYCSRLPHHKGEHIAFCFSDPVPMVAVEVMERWS